MQNLLMRKMLRWKAGELALWKLAGEYLAETEWKPTTAWAFDESSREYYLNFENGRRNSEVMLSEEELLAEFGRSDLSEGTRRKLDDAMGLRDRR